MKGDHTDCGPVLPATALRIDAPTGNGSAGTLRALSSFEPYELADYLGLLKERLPDVAIELWRMPTATLTEYLLAGARADLIIGWADTASATPGVAERIAQPDAADIRPDADGFCRPTGFSTAFVTDPAELARRGAATPNSWSSLADASLANGVIFPDPRRSGAGYLALTTLLQYLGERSGWELMRAIDRNVVDYPGSAWSPAASVGADRDIAVGVTVKIAATRRMHENAALAIALPNEAIGAEAEVYGMLRGTTQRRAVERVLAWLTSPDAKPYFERHAKLILDDANRETLFEVDAPRATRERDTVLRRFDELIHARVERSALSLRASR
ncbi:ABC transporter substrate-binding protein [Trinickia acidisoli]|uniref:ABC transporter substrate-binding protein n=1 Tax=Trinickia acidisoli TaxID=2767482 RepID=UPI001A8CEC1C|nr:substrate-binding domain-containing protein [Trinickia acidisoli]